MSENIPRTENNVKGIFTFTRKPLCSKVVTPMGILQALSSGSKLAAVTIGENIRRLREAAGYVRRQNEFADLVGVKQSRLSLWETTDMVPETTMLVKVAKALNCSVDDLLAGVDADYDQVVRTIRPAAPVAHDGTSMHDELGQEQGRDPLRHTSEEVSKAWEGEADEADASKTRERQPGDSKERQRKILSLAVQIARLAQSDASEDGVVEPRRARQRRTARSHR